LQEGSVLPQADRVLTFGGRACKKMPHITSSLITVENLVVSHTCARM